MKKATKVIFLFVLLFNLLTPSQSVHADIAPPPAPQLGGLEPYQETNVQMVYERVEIDVQPVYYSDDEYPIERSRVYVVAYFTMRNLGKSPEMMQAIFPLESFTNCPSGVNMGNSYSDYYIDENSFKVMISGHEVPIQKIITDHPHTGCPEMTWAGFDVTFPVDEDVVIQVNYVMESYGVDSMQNIEYILETGAGWAGSIERGYVIVKFPYTATPENVLTASTPGYQFLYNEIFWSFESLEPTSENNIQVSIVSPGTWQKILSLRRDLKEDPKLPEEWLKLAQIYEDISIWHADNIRSGEYFQKVYSVYEQGVLENPYNAELLARYAQFKLYGFSPRLIRQLTSNEANQIIVLLNRALALDSDNAIAQQTLLELLSVFPSLTYTPPPTIPPTITAQFTATPSITPSTTITPLPSETPVIVTVVHTKVVNDLKVITTTPEPETLTSTPSYFESPVQEQTQGQSSTVPMIFGAFILFIAGAGAGIFWQKRRA